MPDDIIPTHKNQVDTRYIIALDLAWLSHNEVDVYSKPCTLCLFHHGIPSIRLIACITLINGSLSH